MNKIILSILTLILIMFSGCSSTSINTNPQTEDGTAINTESITDYKIQIASDKINGYKSIHKFGHNPDIDTASGFETIWNGGGDYTGFPNTTDTLEIFSSSGSDTLLGVGARTITIQGLLDSNYNVMPDITVNLSGTTPVSLGVQTYLRANRMSVISTGSSNNNVGLITLRHTLTPTNIFAVMPIGYGQTMISAYTVPTNKTAYMTSWFGALSGKTTGISDIRFMVRPFNQTFQVREELSIVGSGTSYFQRNYAIYKSSMPAKSDIKIIADSSVNNMEISAGFDLLIIDN